MTEAGRHDECLSHSLALFKAGEEFGGSSIGIYACMSAGGQATASPPGHRN